MSAAGYGSWVKLHDAWMLDGAMARLMAEGRHDAVCLFFAAIAHCHAHDTDGTLSQDDLVAVAHACHVQIPTVGEAISGREVSDTDGISALIGSRLVVIHKGGRAGSHYRIVQYAKWQTTSDQRKDEAERSRARRGRPTKKESVEKRESVEGSTERSTAVERPGKASRPPSDGTITDPRRDFDDGLDPAEVYRRASLRIAGTEAAGDVR